ncbi:MAG: hypothetical protein KR126chlam3_00672 [Chlamydiae bacterium]|nr:hypothetical protein [Chlamydiota bacterium]
MDEGNFHCRHFAESKGFQYMPLIDIYKNKKIPFPEGKNFEGVLCTSQDPCMIPIEHTTVPQNKADFLLSKIYAGKKIKNNSPAIRDSSLPNEAFKAAQKKHEKSEGYSNCVSQLENHGDVFSEKRILLLIRFDPYNSPLYNPEDFKDESELLSDARLLLERKGNQLSFFTEIYYGAYFPGEKGITLCLELVYKIL